MKISVGNIVGEELGIVSASYVSSRVFYKDFFNSVRNFFGWELKSYSTMADKARDEVTKRLTERAESIGANAVSNLKFEISYMMSGSLATIAYGNAVKLVGAEKK